MENGFDTINYKVYDGDILLTSGSVPIRFLHLLTGNYLLKHNQTFRIETEYKGEIQSYSYWLPPKTYTEKVILKEL